MVLNPLSRDQINKAFSENLPVYRNGKAFVITAMYYSELGSESKWLVDYVKISKKDSRIRTRDLVSFCTGFSMLEGK